MESQIFWFVATVTCVLAFGFSLKQRRLVAEASKASGLELARSQEKDNWLTCVVVWGVILSGHTDFAETLQVLGSLILGWTAWRTLRRVLILQR